MLAGWRRTGAVAMADLTILTPSTKDVATAAAAEGAALNPEDLSGVRRVVLAVKPARWREVAEALVDRLPRDALVVSVMAGVDTFRLRRMFADRPVARVMPTTAVAAARGVATVWAEEEDARIGARALFAPIAELVEVEDEAMIDVATAMSGSGAAYAYAFVRALARAGEDRGLAAAQARALALATTAGAVTRLLEGPADIDALIAEVASPGGTTEAGLAVLEPDLTGLLARTVAASLARVRTLDPDA